MANEVLLKSGGCISFADHAADFGPGANNVMETGTPTDVQLSMASVADGAARQSAKADLGANWARGFSVKACLEFAATPTAGEVVELYWAPSDSGTAAVGNPGGCSGSDAAYTGDSSNLAAAVKQLEFIGAFVCTEVATAEGVQKAVVTSYFAPSSRYGSLVFKNESGAAMHSDDVECNIVMIEAIDEVQ